MKHDEEYRPQTIVFSLNSTMSAEKSENESSVVSESNPAIMPLTLQNAVYRGEGNANIVIALPHEHKVIRFRKSLLGEVSPDGGKRRVQREVWFAKNVVSRFLGSYMQIPEIIHYDAADVIKLSNAIHFFRPEKRRHKEILDTFATKFPDYTFLNPHLRFDRAIFRNKSTFCVEIKPKQGYIERTERRFSSCPYCLNQYAKLRKRIIGVPSDYCPFDLFSGVEERTKAAVNGLLRSPQNNLKIFKDGLVVYDQQSSPSDLEGVLDEWFRNAARCNGHNAVDEFCNLVCAALMRPFAREQLEPVAFRSRNFFVPVIQNPTFCGDPNAVTRIEKCLNLAGKKCNFNGKDLPRDSVLERVQNMQRLPYINTDFIYDIYSKFTSLLDDDTMYSDLIKSEGAYVSTISSTLSNNHTNIIIQEPETMKEAYFQTLLKSTVMGRCNKNLNGNENTDSDYVSSIRETFSDGDPTPQIKISNVDLCQSPRESKSPRNYGRCDDMRKANTLITAEHLLLLQNYLLCATARDCSILMTFRELDPENVSMVPAENTIKLSKELYFLSSIGVSDLDPKSVHSIKKHRQRDVDIFDSVISLLEEDLLPETS